MRVRPDGFFLFLKTSYVFDMGLLLKLNYRPAKTIFTREIIHILLVDTVPCSAESLSSGKAALAGSLTHARLCLPQHLRWAPGTIHNLHLKHGALLHSKVPQNAPCAGAVLIPWTPTHHCSFISPLCVGIYQLVHRSSLRCPCLWHLPPQQSWCGGLSHFGASCSRLIYWIQRRVELKVSEMREQTISFLTGLFALILVQNLVANLKTM